MALPVAVVGLTDSVFTAAVMTVRRHVHEKGMDTGDTYLHTLPHLSLVWNPEFRPDTSEAMEVVVRKIVGDMESFTVPVTEICAYEGTSVASFDNALSMQLSLKIAGVVGAFGFDPVLTDHMKIVRAEVVPERLDDVLAISRKTLPAVIGINRIALMGGELRETDILWEIPLRP